MRIAFYHCVQTGGAKRSFYEQLKLLGKNHQIDLYTLKGIEKNFLPLDKFVNETFEFELKDNFPIKPWFFLKSFFIPLLLYRSERLARQIAKKIDSGNYDIVYLTHGRTINSPSVMRYLRTPKVYYSHEPPRDVYEPQPLSGKNRDHRSHHLLRSLLYQPLRYLYKTIDKRNIKYADKVLVNSLYSQKKIKEIYGMASEVAYNGVDTERFRPQAIEKENMVIAVGALHWRKGHRFVIESLALLEDRPKLVIVADRRIEYEEKYLLGLAEKLKVEVKIYKDLISDEELIELYNKAKVCVCAQIREPFGLIPLETMACGVPVVAVSEGGFSETIVDGRTGILTKRDLGEFAQAVSRLIKDEDLRNRLGIQAREYVIKKWQWGIAVEKVENILLTFQTNFNMAHPECNICRTRRSKFIFTKKRLHYFICRDCGLVFIFPRPTQKELTQEYGELGKKYFTSKFKIKMDFSENYNDIFDSIERFRINNRILEIGSSTGSFLMAARNKGWTTFGTEISEASTNYAITQHQLNIFKGELTDAHFPAEYFDVVVIMQTLEHLPEPDTYIKECYRILRKKGLLFISVPNFGGLTYSFVKSRYFYMHSEHLFYFNPGNVNLLLRKSGFQIIRLKTVGLDFFNLILGRFINVDLIDSMQTQRGIMKTNIWLKETRIIRPFISFFKLLMLPIHCLKKGDSIFVYAEKS